MEEIPMEVVHRDGSRADVSDQEEALEILRHSTSHLMALAVMELFPDVSLGIGPATSEGFYYDFQASHRFTEEDLGKIQQKMEELRSEGLPFEPSIINRDEALELFQQKGEQLKIELIEDRESETLSCYRLGRLVDFCLGPHVPSSSHLGAFKLLSIAGSYWKGDENREQLQRIYGTAFFFEDELNDYLAHLEEVKKRDHRRLGKDLDLFSVQEHVAPGLVFWHPKGAAVRGIIETYLKEELEKGGYQFVYTPHIAKSDLWKTSGHYSYYLKHMYTLPVDEEEYVLKPMNCPGHVMIYKSQVRSYRELPVRLAELGTVYRYEKSGTLHGLLRVRGFTQDDAHIFCRPEQVQQEVVMTLDLAEKILKTFGFEGYNVTLSVWDPEKQTDYAGTADDWAEAERILVEVLEEKGWGYEKDVGEAAFYGPKIDVKLIDALGRSWQLSTFQFDFNLPARFGVTYVGADSKPHHVVMIHRALLGSMERFMGVLIEQYAGAFPAWLAPVQAVVIPISDRHHEYARKVEMEIRGQGFRVDADLRNEKLGKKIREAQLQKVPFMLVVGDREAESGAVSVRSRKEGDQGAKSVAEFVETLRELVDTKAVKP
jgi:threonyl-tRNA synthetase